VAGLTPELLQAEITKLSSRRAIGQTSARQICIADPRANSGALFLQEWFDQTWKLNEFELIG
jgi:hypothetical protein